MKQIDPKYINGDGFVTAKANAETIPGEGNGWLQTGLAWACGMIPTPPDEMLLRSVYPINMAWLSRSPHKQNPDDNETCDDYWGALPMFPWWSKVVLSHAEYYKWNFAPLGKKKSEYQFDLFPAFPTFLRICAGKTPSLWECVCLAGTILWDAFHIEHADTNMAAYCRIKAVEEHSVWCALAGDIWRMRVREKYGTIGKSWAAYFAPGHTLADFEEEAE